jgi:hypothetical protein
MSENAGTLLGAGIADMINRHSQTAKAGKAVDSLLDALTAGGDDQATGQFFQQTGKLPQEVKNMGAQDKLSWLSGFQQSIGYKKAFQELQDAAEANNFNRQANPARLKSLVAGADLAAGGVQPNIDLLKAQARGAGADADLAAGSVPHRLAALQSAAAGDQGMAADMANMPQMLNAGGQVDYAMQSAIRNRNWNALAALGRAREDVDANGAPKTMDVNGNTLAYKGRWAQFAPPNAGQGPTMVENPDGSISTFNGRSWDTKFPPRDNSASDAKALAGAALEHEKLIGSLDEKIQMWNQRAKMAKDDPKKFQAPDPGDLEELKSRRQRLVQGLRPVAPPASVPFVPSAQSGSPPASGAPPTINTQAEWDNLPSGTVFRSSRTGKLIRKP